MALADNGTVWTWGANNFGQLGDGTTTPRKTPAKINGLADVTGIAASVDFSLALKQDGTVWIWGGDANAKTIYSRIPVELPGLQGITSTSAGMAHVLALKSDGTVWAWGSNADGRLGDGTNKDRFLAKEIPGLSGGKAVAAGAHHSVALKNDGTVWTWGPTPTENWATARTRPAGRRCWCRV